MSFDQGSPFVYIDRRCLKILLDTIDDRPQDVGAAIV